MWLAKHFESSCESCFQSCLSCHKKNKRTSRAERRLLLHVLSLRRRTKAQETQKPPLLGAAFVT